MLKKTWVSLVVCGVFGVANFATAGEVIVEGHAYRGSTVRLSNHMVGNGRSRLYGAADCGGRVIGSQYSSGLNGGTVQSNMALQSIGGTTIGTNRVEANGPGSISQSDLTAGSYFGQAQIQGSAVAGPFGNTQVIGRSFAEFGGQSLVNAEGFSAGFNGGQGAVRVDAYGRSFGPFTVTDVRAQGLGYHGGFGSVDAVGRGIGVFAPVRSSVMGLSEGWGGSISEVEASDVTISD